MAAGYDPSGLKTSIVYQARFQLGDKGQLRDEAGDQVWLLQDEEIQSNLELFGYNEGVARVADALAVQYAQEPSEYQDEGGVKVKWADRIQTWRSLAALLRTPSAATATPTGGGYLSRPSLGPYMGGFRL